MKGWPGGGGGPAVGRRSGRERAAARGSCADDRTGKIMAAMFSTFSDWSSLVVGVALLIQAAVFAASGRRASGGNRAARRRRDRTMSLLLGLTFTVHGATDVAHLTGSSRHVALGIGLFLAIAAVVTSIRLVMAREAERWKAAESGPASPGTGV